MKIVEVWKKQRLEYQQRYAKNCKRFNESQSEYDRGHLLESSWVLIEVFGLTCKEVDEVEKNGGFTNKDLEN